MTSSECRHGQQAYTCPHCQLQAANLANGILNRRCQLAESRAAKAEKALAELTYWAEHHMGYKGHHRQTISADELRADGFTITEVKP